LESKDVDNSLHLNYNLLAASDHVSQKS